MLQLLEDSPMPPEQRDLVSTARYSGNALVRIISDILDFSRMESGKMQLLLEAFDVKTAILYSLRLFQQEAERKNLRFDIAVDPAIPEALKGDDARFRQIIFNLVGNAFKFTERGSVHVACSVTNRLPDGKVRLKICVADTGIGIPSQKQQTVFEAFTQVDNASTQK